eukprot:749203-Hanusia_phi.AAC.2
MPSASKSAGKSKSETSCSPCSCSLPPALVSASSSYSSLLFHSFSSISADVRNSTWQSGSDIRAKMNIEIAKQNAMARR